MARTTLAEEIRELIRAEIALDNATTKHAIVEAAEHAESAFRMMNATIDDLITIAATERT